MKTIALMNLYGNLHYKLGPLAIKTFTHHNPDIELLVLTENNPLLTKFHPEPTYNRYLLAKDLLESGQADNVINIGADTITFGPVTELINPDGDINVTLDYKYAFDLGPNDLIPTINGEIHHFNADVVCFKNPEMVGEIISTSINSQCVYNEQFGLNYVCHKSKQYTYNLIDGVDKNVFYNVRSKGLDYYVKFDTYIYHDCHKFILDNNKNLFNKDLIPIKMFHMCDRLGRLSTEHYKLLVDFYFQEMFPRSVVQYLEEILNK